VASEIHTDEGDRTSIARLMRILATRMSWSAGAKLIVSTGLHRGRGWAESVASVATVPLNATGLRRARQTLEDVLGSHILFGEKAVTWYLWSGAADGAAELISRWVERVQLGRLLPPATAPRLSDTPTGQRELKALVGSPPALHSVTREAGLLTFVFSSARTYTSREQIDVSAFPPAQRRRFDDYLKVIGLKARHVPCFDVVAFDLAKARTELRMDHQLNMKSDQEDSARTDIINQVNGVLFKAIQHAPIGLGAVDFFPAVRNLYAGTVGQVEHLGFLATAPTASSNNNCKVHRRAGQDLRRDPFHLGGKRAVTSVDPYTIGVSAAGPSGYDRVLLEVNGNVRMMFGPRSALATAGFHGCVTADDFEFLTQTLESHLPAATP
jgi:hypothetical protein